MKAHPRAQPDIRGGLDLHLPASPASRTNTINKDPLPAPAAMQNNRSACAPQCTNRVFPVSLAFHGLLP